MNSAIATLLLDIEESLKTRSASVSREQGQRAYDVHAERLAKVMKLPRVGESKKHVTKFPRLKLPRALALCVTRARPLFFAIGALGSLQG